MYYRLNEDYALRGWEDLPCAVAHYRIRETEGKGPRFETYVRPYFFSEEAYELIRRFDGQTPVSLDELTAKEKRAVRTALEKSIVTESEQPMEKLTAFQEYRFFPALYIQEVVWSISGRCNYRCRHCILSAPDGIHPELPFEDCVRIADQLAECGINTVALTGGEPLIRRDFPRFVEMLTERDIRISMIMTNGKLLTKQILDCLRENGQHPAFQISFDGFGFHDRMRGITGAEQAALDAMRLMIEEGFPVTAAMCIDRQSAGSIRETALRLGEMGVDSLGISSPQRFGAWENADKDIALSFAESLDLFLDYIPQFFEDGMPITVSIGGVFQCNRHGTDYSIPAVRNFDTDEELRRHLICDTARFRVYISAEGQLMPCLGYGATGYASEFPNVLQIPMKDILHQSRTREIMTCRMKEYFAKNEKCRTCKKRLKCAGGCRVNAMTVHRDNNMGIDEDACYFHLGGYEERIRETADSAIRRLSLPENSIGIPARALPAEG